VSVKIPNDIHRLLWEYDLDDIDLWTELPEVVIERVMALGGWVQMQWLLNEVETEDLRSYLERKGARVLPPREIAFWGLACSVPDALVQEWVIQSRARRIEWRRLVNSAIT